MQPLPTKLVLRKKRAQEGRSTDEIEHFPAPSRVTVRRRPTVSVVELKEPEVQVQMHLMFNLIEELSYWNCIFDLVWCV